ncbi:unnamed protein product, partial [Brassica napus]
QVGLKFINLEFKSRDAFQLKFQAWNRTEALASQVTEENFADGLIYPPFTNIRKISANIAASVGAKTYELGLASNLPRPKDLVKTRFFDFGGKTHFYFHGKTRFWRENSIFRFLQEKSFWWENWVLRYWRENTFLRLWRKNSILRFSVGKLDFAI